MKILCNDSDRQPNGSTSIIFSVEKAPDSAVTAASSSFCTKTMISAPAKMQSPTVCSTSAALTESLRRRSASKQRPRQRLLSSTTTNKLIIGILRRFFSVQPLCLCVTVVVISPDPVTTETQRTQRFTETIKVFFDVFHLLRQRR